MFQPEFSRLSHLGPVCATSTSVVTDHEQSILSVKLQT